MDEVHTKSDLVRSPHETEILGQLKHGGIRKTRGSAASEVEPARHADDGHLGPAFREVHILHAQVAQCEKCIVDSFEERPSCGRTEGTNRTCADQIRIAQNSRLSSSSCIKIRCKQIRGIIAAGIIKTRV